MSKKSISESAIIRFFDRTADKISECVSNSAIGRAFGAYDNEKSDADKSIIFKFFAFLFSKIGFKKAQRSFMKGLNDSPILAFTEYIKNRLITARTRQYGVMLLSFGFYSLLMYALGVLSLTEHYKGSNVSLFVGVLCIISSVPMLISKNTLAKGVFHSVIGNKIFVGIFGLSEYNIDDNIRHKGKTTLPLIVGMFFGILTFFVGIERIIISFIFTVLCLLVFASPEGGIVLLVSFAPLCSERLITLFAVFILFSYFFKVFRGKRSFKNELCDFSVMLYAFVIMFGGIFSVRPNISFSYSVKLLIYILLYFVVVNTIASKKWISRLRSAFVFSLTMCIIVFIMQKTALSSTHILFEYNISTGTVNSLFNSIQSFSFLIVLLGFIPFVSLANAHNSLRKLFIILIIACELYCLYLTDLPLVMLAFIIALAVFLLIYSNKNIFLIILFAIAVPASGYLLPSAMNNKIAALSSSASSLIADRISLWRSSLSLAFDNFLGGIGKGVFHIIFPSYAKETNIGSVSCNNIYLGELIDVGIFGLIVFLICMIFFIQSNFRACKIAINPDNKISDTAAGLVGIIGILLCGFIYNVWSDEKIFILFWLVFSYTSACRKYSIMKSRKPDFYEEGSVIIERNN